MNYCKKCGSVIPDGQTQCPNCIPEKNIDIENKLREAGNYVKNTATNILADCPDHTHTFEGYDILANRNYCILSYLSWLCVIPIFKCRSPYARFHANQGLILAIVSTILFLISGTVDFFLGNAFLLSIIPTILKILIRLVVAAYSCLGIYNAVTHKARELPLIGKFQLLK